jgi:hypothetical protein
MKGLSKLQIAARSAACKAIREAQGKLGKEVDEFNATVQRKFIQVELALSAYNSALGDAGDFVAGVAEEIEGFLDGKSDRFKDSDRGVALAGWMAEWQATSFDELEIPFPEALEGPDNDVADELEGLPEAPE